MASSSGGGGGGDSGGGAGAATVSVLLASAQSVAKVFVVGAIGYFAVKFPRKSPLLLSESVSAFARFSFHVLLLPLVYSTTAVSVTPETIGKFWFVVVAAFYVIGTSYAVSTALNYPAIIPRKMRIENPRDFGALRISATFPNVVAIPILCLPTLCEYPVVHEGYALEDLVVADDDLGAAADEGNATRDLQQECVALSNTLVFCYFAAWSLLFWTVGYPSLMAAAKLGSGSGDSDDNKAGAGAVGGEEQPAGDGNASVLAIDGNSASAEAEDGADVNCEQKQQQQPSEGNGGNADEEAPPCTGHSEVRGSEEQQEPNAASASSVNNAHNGEEGPTRLATLRTAVARALRQTLTSPGFLALLAGAATGCIAPLREALFGPGGALRFLGSAAQTLGSASSPLSAIVVAASLVPAAPAIEPSRQRQTDSAPPSTEESRHTVDASSKSAPAGYEGNSLDADEEEEGNCCKLPEDETKRTAACSKKRGKRAPSLPILIRHAANRDDEGSSIEYQHQDNPIMSDPVYGPYRRRREKASLQRLGSSIRRRSARVLEAVGIPKERRPRNAERRKLVWWFTLSRLVVAPAVVVGTVVGLDCGNVIPSVPAMAKLVVIVNSCVPGAQIVVVLLKSRRELADTASAVANVYLPTYLLSIVTITAWTALGLWVTLPDERGKSFCQR